MKPTARSQLFDMRGAGDMLGLDRYTGARACPHTARSESDVVLYAFPAEDFEACVLKYPQAVQYVEAEGRSSLDYQPGGRRRDLQDMFLHDVVARKPLVTCRMDDRLDAVAARLLACQADALTVVDAGGRPVGVLTLASILQWTAAGGGDARRTCAELQVPVATPPTVLPDISLADGVLAMGSSGVGALAVTADGTRNGRLQALVTTRDLAPIFGEHPVALLAEIESAAGTDSLREINRRTRAFALTHLSDPSSIDWLSRLVHLIDRAIFRRLMTLTSAESVNGAWCFAGSSGRAESLTKLAPLPVLVLEHDDQIDLARRAYQHVIDGLLECDYLPRAELPFEWEFYVASVPEWNTRFRQWIDDPVRHEVYRARMLFDLRPVAGPVGLWDAVEADAVAAVDPTFVRILANDCLAALPPLTFFQDAVVDREGEPLATFRLQHSALHPLVDVGRVFGIATGACFQRSTLDRFAAARTRLPQHQAIFREASDTVRIVLGLQARVGIGQGTAGLDLPPALLSSYDRRVLKGGFRSILRLLEFTNDSSWLDQL